MKRYEDPKWMQSMRIRVDYNNMMQANIGAKGIGEELLQEQSPRLKNAAQSMRLKRSNMRWRELPYEQEEAVNRILETADEIRGFADAFVVLGIGGSALGPMAVQYALNHTRYNELSGEKRKGPRLYIEDNIDPERMRALLDVIEVEHTVFNVITKSGSTSETMSQLLLIFDELAKSCGAQYQSHVIATTDKSKGNLIKIARELGLRTFYVPDGVGGRFSELCPVGLLPAAVCGIDIREMLAGAAYMDGLCSQEEIRQNPAYMLGALDVFAFESGCNINVMIPYAESLRYMSDWFAQLWAESLGKRYNNNGEEVFYGQTPVKALGVTDQHSQVQLYTEGPFDKVITFLGVDRYRIELEIPRGFENIPDIAFLGGHTFNELYHAEQAATEYALQKNGRMNKTIILPEVNAFTVGELLYLLEMQTAFAGELLGINAFDQPGVEEGKNATYALLGKPGYDLKRKELQARPPKNEAYMA